MAIIAEKRIMESSLPVSDTWDRNAHDRECVPAQRHQPPAFSVIAKGEAWFWCSAGATIALSARSPVNNDHGATER
jgi:hypothetical protein